jgi:hemerythrin-like domain-containing protein
MTRPTDPVTDPYPDRRGQERADTTMMGVVHDAIRRDLHRLHRVLAPSDDPLPAARRAAVGDHALWMMDFLHRHHRGEDDGLWPMLLRRAPQTASLIARMEADHHAILPAMRDVDAAARAFRNDPRAQKGLAAALDNLSAVLLPHLRREEDEAMPVVASALTVEDWQSWDQRYNVRGKSLTCLAMDGHWLMDQLDPQRYRTLVHLVPPTARLLIVRGFAGRYRRACALRWGADVPVRPLAADADPTHGPPR